METSVTALMSIFHKACIDCRNTLESVVVHGIAKSCLQNDGSVAITHVELFTIFTGCSGLFLSLQPQQVIHFLHFTRLYLPAGCCW